MPLRSLLLPLLAGLVLAQGPHAGAAAVLLATSRERPREIMVPGLIVCDNGWTLELRQDGMLRVVGSNGVARWESGPTRPNCQPELWLQDDMNLVVYDVEYDQAGRGVKHHFMWGLLPRAQTRVGGRAQLELDAKGTLELVEVDANGNRKHLARR